MVDEKDVVGGMLWAAPWPMCWRRVLVLTDAGFILTNNFAESEGASTHHLTIDGTYKDAFTQEELVKYFTENEWECLGQVKYYHWPRENNNEREERERTMRQNR